MSEIGRSTQKVVRENRVGTIPKEIWAPLAAGALTLVPGLLALATGQPLLFPSLAPTAALQAAQPQEQSARLYNVVVGHLVGIVAAALFVLLLGAGAEPSLFQAHQNFPRRMYASVLAVAVTMLVQLGAKALHPPAMATVLLITLGGFKTTWQDLGIVALGIVIMGLSGERVRQMRLIQPGQK